MRHKKLAAAMLSLAIIPAAYAQTGLFGTESPNAFLTTGIVLLIICVLGKLVIDMFKK